MRAQDLQITSAFLSICALACGAGSEHSARETASASQGTQLPVRVPFTHAADGFNYELPLDSATAGAIADHFVRTYNPTHGRITVFAISENLSLVSGVTPHAYRFVLYRHGQDGRAPTVVDTTHDMGDSDWLRPYFFERQGALLVLADIGSEYSWGLIAFEIAADRLRQLPAPDVARPDYESEMGPSDEALSAVTAFFHDETYELHFNTDLVLNPGRSRQALLCRTRGPIVLRLTADTWEVIGATRRDAPVNQDLSPCP